MGCSLFHRRRPGKKYRFSGGLQWLLAAIIGVGLACFLIGVLESAVRPAAIELAGTQLQNTVQQLLAETTEEVLADEGLSFDDMVELKLGTGDRVTALVTNPVFLNSISAKVLQSVLYKVNQLNSIDVKIPVSGLISWIIPASWGPVLPVRILAAAAPDAAWRNEFTSAGINQTLYRIMLDVTVNIKLLTPAGIGQAQVASSLCLAETIIVGQVPETYLGAGVLQSSEK